MNVEQLISVNLKIWEKYLTKISKLKLQNGSILFPNLILVTEVDNYFIIELLGSTPVYNGLKLKKNTAENVNSYLYHFNYSKHDFEPAASNELNLTSISGMSIGSSIPEKILKERFFFQNRWGSKLIAGNGLASMDMFNFGKRNYLEFNDVCIVNKLQEIYRLKSINHLHIISKHIPKEVYKKFLIQNLFKELKPTFSQYDIKGVLFSMPDNIDVDVIYSQFLNIYSFQKLRETTIGDFLNENPIILQNAFQSSNIIYEPELEWLEGNPDDDEVSINPDFLIKREDGYYDIFDLKLPYWDKQKLTKGKHRRRSFLQIVDEAIAQLANYEDYFNYEENRSLAKKKYNVEINNPQLIIVIGNYSNYDKNEIKEASRKLKDNFLIIDYDTLNLKFYNGSKNFA